MYESICGHFGNINETIEESNDALQTRYVY